MGIALLLLALAANDTLLVADEPRPEFVTLAGEVVVGSKGTPLYVYDGRVCDEGCRRAWPPLEAAAGAKPVGDWYPHDGQWTYKRHYVFYFANDRDGKKATGDGIGGVWYAIRNLGAVPRVTVPAGVKVGKIGTEFLLTDARGLTLYNFMKERGPALCKVECLDVWPPLVAPALAKPIGEWTPVERPDGLRQWAFRGRLVYTFSEDTAPGQAGGARAKGVWATIPVTERDARATKVARNDAGKRDEGGR